MAERMGAETLPTEELGRVVTLYADALGTYQEEINGLNVYPVPDGDTGTNLRLTLDSVRKALDGTDDVPHSIIRGSLMGARGNSGVILSQILRGISEAIQESGGLSPRSMPDSSASIRNSYPFACRIAKQLTSRFHCSPCQILVTLCVMNGLCAL